MASPALSKETNPRVKVYRSSALAHPFDESCCRGRKASHSGLRRRPLPTGSPSAAPENEPSAGSEIRRRYCDREEEEIANAILLLLEREKTLAEGAGAAAIAAVLNRKLPLEGKRVAVLVCGGNIDVTLLARIIERGLVKDGRLVRLRVHLAGLSRRAISAHRNSRRSSRQHRRDRLRSRLPRRQSRRHRDRYHDGNPRSRPHRGTADRAGFGWIHARKNFVSLTARLLSELIGESEDRLGSRVAERHLAAPAGTARCRAERLPLPPFQSQSISDSPSAPALVGAAIGAANLGFIVVVLLPFMHRSALGVSISRSVTSSCRARLRARHSRHLFAPLLARCRLHR